MTDQSIEQEIQAKGLTAPRVTPADLVANIVDTEIVKHVSKSGQVLRWAVLTTRNGFAVAGKPSCAASSANDDAELGEKMAIENATDELWPLMGYALKQTLSNEAPLVKQKPPYTWQDVANYATFSNNLKGCTEFVIQIKGDDRKYQGRVPDGFTENEGRKAAILECNRQRDESNA